MSIGVLADGFAAYAGFSTTFPSCQTINGSLKARLCALTLCAARRNARSARVMKAGAFPGLGVLWPFFFIRQSTFAQIQYHDRQKWRAVLRADCSHLKPPSVWRAEGSPRANER